MAEHLAHFQVERAHAVALLESEVGVAGSLAHHVERSAFAFGYLPNVVYVFLVYEQSHTFLALVGYYLLGRERRVADGQFGHVYESAAVFHQLAQAVHVSCAAVVVDRHHGIDLLLAESAHQVVGAFLHLGVGALHSVKLYAAAVASGLYGRHRASSQADAVVVASHHYYLVTLLRSAFQTVALGAVAHTSCQHYHFVVGVLLAVLLMLEGEDGAADERLTELVAEVAGTVGSLDENLLGCLVEPLPDGKYLFPFPVLLGARIAGHVHGSSGYGPRAYATSHTVAYLAACACAGSVERLHGGGEVVRLGLDADDAFDVAYHEVVAGAVVGGSELFHHWTFSERHVVLVCRDYLVRVFLGSLLYHLEETALLLFSVYDECAAEYLVPAVLAVDLRETEHFGIGELASQLLLHVVQVGYLFGGECQSFLLVVCLQVVNVLYGCRGDVHVEYLLVQTVVHTLQHGVVLGVFAADGEIFLYAHDALYGHVLRYFHRVGAPWSYHLSSRTHEEALHLVRRL